MSYTELQTTTNFSFLKGASHPAELVSRAKALGLSTLGITDHNTLAGIVRAHSAAKEENLHLLVGARLDLIDGPSLLCYPSDRAAYGRLCQLLTLGKRRAEKGDCHLFLKDVYAHADGQNFILIPPYNLTNIQSDTKTQNDIKNLNLNLEAPLYLAASVDFKSNAREHLNRLSDLSHHINCPMIATNDILYHTPDRKPLQDILTCIREKCTIQQAGFHLEQNAERHLKSTQEMLRLFKGHEDAVHRTQEIVNACTFSLDELRYEYPEEPVPKGKTPQNHLEDITWQGAALRYPTGIPKKIDASIRHELDLIRKLNYAPYFLTVYDIVKYARNLDQEILCQGRGSAANSVVCYCIGITSVDPAQIDLLFERFVSEERQEPPDIDVDFEHERREEVIQYIYNRYGRDRAGITATVITYRGRSAIREVGKAMGLSEDVVSALAGTVWGMSRDGLAPEYIREAGLDPDDPYLQKTLALTMELLGFPRHLSQHTGGFVLTRGPLCEVVPIGNAAMDDRTFVEWDKDDLDTLCILKIDVLALGMLTCIRKCFELLEDHYDRPLTLATVPQEDPAVYDMLCKADSLGVFQVESRAQMNMLPRLKPRCFYDLVIEVAIVRPGPIQGDMVHPYLRRRDGIEKVEYPSPAPEHGPPDELERVLKKTLGVPLFQEQAMRIAIEAAKFTPSEANKLRRAMATFRHLGNINTMKDKMVGGMIARGYDPDLAERCFRQIEGFGEYGFPESHSASFSLLVYVSSWIKCHYPEIFACGLLNAQPLGFYAPAQIIRDAREHGVEVRPIDINFSDWDCHLEPASPKSGPNPSKTIPWALRLGFRLVDGLSKTHANELVERRNKPYASIHDLWQQAQIPVFQIEKLASADAFNSMGLNRRQALWDVRALQSQTVLPLFAKTKVEEQGPDQKVNLPAMSLGEHVTIDYQTTGLSLKAHPIALLRKSLAKQGLIPAQRLLTLKDKTYVQLTGVVLVRQRPGSAKGVIFITIEDETGVANIVVWPKTMEKYRKIVMSSRLLYVSGPIQKEGQVIHVIAHHLSDESHCLDRLPETHTKRGPQINHQKPKPSPPAQARHPRNVRIIPKSRDFH